MWGKSGHVGQIRTVENLKNIYWIGLILLSLVLLNIFFLKNFHPIYISGTYVNLRGANMDSHFQTPFP